ncbi:helix-turn-helix domain-containing protein [Paramaledivibacter caminithermalis]|jgi:transcriptional regulator with XRE-family HTH domain|uniref:Transcriptional regulator, contains XRE-family HTH domain n=1 Tax=Paramaledivibacter caminithermalis (strain DSM 15212 / CIP 107654 / DViRD3) TaxID=1121301 RepID=A0A1M6K523_PARC5|nr:helix-turn-helix domain-containing protein [Paramaledivibacter caminithermalis]SHJ54017.1 Transcriptional regulator, contains XRE-family HTH domain [Paramaledivibacter caminithermalis DSM 15212]
MRFGDKLKKLRTEKGLSQKKLGEILNISSRTIGYYETNERFPKDEDTLKAIADYFNVSVDYLLGRTNNPNEVDGYLTDEEADKLADEIIEIYIKKGKIKPGEELTPEKREKILREIEAFIEMTNKLEGN